MDFLDKLVGGGDGCAADGTATASNPVGALVDGLMPLQHDDGTMGMGPGGAAAGPDGLDAFYGPRPGAAVAPNLQALGDEIFAAQSAQGDAWAAEFQGGGHAAAPPPESMAAAWGHAAQGRVAPPMEAAWAAEEAKGAEEAAWVDAAAAGPPLEQAWEAGAAAPSLEAAWAGEADPALSAAAARQDAWKESKATSMGAAWEEAAHEAFQEGDVLGQGSKAGLKAAWERMQAQLESLDADKEYELGDMNEFDAMDQPFEAGMELFASGHLTKAAQAFEAAIRADPSHADAWRMLGMTHAENEEDVRAIQCLEKAVSVDPYSLEALLALGVSYVNEMNPEKVSLSRIRPPPRDQCFTNDNS
uniref:Peroxin-5 n=1 Tax=Phaeomonas parva TaxID=124430 RepID=A0A7S1UMB0_9STRA|mmetsp:Transcript_8982/g.26091  ORF Transcript_8982/g.26091 Transcript_8982/m.26091 type:complete len:359 (+) Transcript_8982:427-1503(+)